MAGSAAAVRLRHAAARQLGAAGSGPLSSRLTAKGAFDPLAIPCPDCTVPPTPPCQVVGGLARAGKVVAAVCHGPMGLVNVTDEAGQPIVKGREVRGGGGVQELPRNASARAEGRSAPSQQRLTPAWLPPSWAATATRAWRMSLLPLAMPLQEQHLPQSTRPLTFRADDAAGVTRSDVCPSTEACSAAATPPAHTLPPPLTRMRPSNATGHGLHQ